MTSASADVNLVISGANLAALSLGRFGAHGKRTSCRSPSPQRPVFLPYQRSSVAKAGSPVQNGMSHVKAGDIRAEEAAGVLKTGDPAGFNLVRHATLHSRAFPESPC